jgi:hypothetical protein
LGKAVGGTGTVRGAGLGTHFQFHQSFGGEADHLTQDVRVGGLLHEGAEVHHFIGHGRFLGCGRVRNPTLPGNR